MIGDTHFGHKKIIEFMHEYRHYSSIEEHDNDLVLKWNSVVSNKDTVWHLGDVFFGGKDSHFILSKLNGIKKLILGNHDIYPIELYNLYFSKIRGAEEIHNCIMTHIPVHPKQLEKRYIANIHGHLHHNKLDDERYICVSAEQNNLTPVQLLPLLTSKGLY